MTKAQIIKARAMMRKAGMDEDNKCDMVASFTDGRTTHLSAMFYDETLNLFKHLENITGQLPDPCDAQRRKMISLAHEMNMRRPGSSRVDIAAIDKWLTTKGGFKKGLHALNYNELNRAVTAFGLVHVDYLKGL